ncbi:MAG: hypothetical protein OQK82_01170 [Candidatus Pacearchaeota archaeon]|nr:hypothetical protein [Candidatus Pacearchaeota archaeon]
MRYIGRASDNCIALFEMSKLNSFSYEELKRNSRDISVENNLIKIAEEKELIMKDNKISLNLFYNNNNIIQIYNPLFLEFFETMIGNCINYAKGEINQATETNNSMTKILTENEILDESRKLEGSGSGTSLYFIKKMIERIDGSYTEYTKPKIDKNQYTNKQSFGYEKTESTKKYSEIFGIEVALPNKLY